MSVSPPTEIIHFEVHVEHPTPEIIMSLRKEIESWCDTHGVTIRTTSTRIRYTHCKKCGYPRIFQTLGSGLFDPADQCRLAYSHGCRRREAAGGYQEETTNE